MFMGKVELACDDDDDNDILIISSESAPEPQRRILQNSYKSDIVRTARLVDKKLFHCDICGKDFSRKEYLQIHENNHLPENPFTCKICGREFNRSFPLKKHQQTHETAEKRREKYKANLFKCKICDEKFPDHSSLLVHYSSKHSNSNDDVDDSTVKEGPMSGFPCHICGKLYMKEISRKRHIPIHKRKPFHCDLCKRNFVLDNQLQEHKAKHGINQH